MREMKNKKQDLKKMIIDEEKVHIEKTEADEKDDKRK